MTTSQHPADLIDDHVSSVADLSTSDEHADALVHMGAAADLLRAYETQHGVKFIAVSAQGLAGVQESIADDGTDLYDAVMDLGLPLDTDPDA